MWAHWYVDTRLEPESVHPRNRKGFSGRLRPVETPSRIEIEAGVRVTLEWEGGEKTTIGAAELRAACLCADCRSDAGERRKALVLQNPEAIRVEGAHIVGAYAVSFEFGPDLHRTGIFSFELLRTLGTTDGGSV
jgi:DUF971 family protein